MTLERHLAMVSLDLILVQYIEELYREENVIKVNVQEIYHRCTKEGQENCDKSCHKQAA